MKCRIFNPSSHNVYWCILYYLIFTNKLVSLAPQKEDPNSKSISPEQFSQIVPPDQVKSVIDAQNSITNKLMSNGMSTIDALQKGASSTVNNVGWYATSLLSNTLKILSNTMEAVKDVGSNTLSAGMRVGKNTLKLADGAVRGILGFAKTETKGLQNQLNNSASFFKKVAKNPEQYIAIPGMSAINLTSLGLPSSGVVQFLYDTNSDSIKAISSSAVASAGTVGWLVSDTLADTTNVLENTLELIDNLKDTTVNTGYKLGENGIELTQTLAGGGFDFVENGLSSTGNQMEGLSKLFKDREKSQQLVDVPLTEATPTK